MERLVLQPLFEGLALGNVAVVEDDAADVWIVEQVLADRLHVYPPAVGVAQTAIDRRAGAGASDKPRKDLAYPVYIVGVHHGRLENAMADPSLGLVAEDPFDRGARVAGDAVGVDHRDDVRRVLH